MILTYYYKMADITNLKSHRMDCVASSGKYEPFERIGKRSKDRQVYFYLKSNPYNTINYRRKADRVITVFRENISSVYTPSDPLKGYGDINGTNDACLFIMSGDDKQMEVFVARNWKNNSLNLYQQFENGNLEKEMQALRDEAMPTNI